jgi:predicted N-acyltransferase
VDGVTLRVLGGIGSVARAAWDALVDSDPLANPFVSHAFLDALESSGCAGPGHGWQARHLTLWRGERLVAAAPAYLKHDHEGDFARDWVWSGAVERAGLRYFPRLLLTVPITPVPGRRILVAAGEDRAAATAALVAGAQRLCRDEKASSVHVIYALASEVADLAAAGLAPRLDVQAHWVNHGYTSPDDFLRRGLNAKQRRNARVERAAQAAQGISIRTVRGAELAAERERYGRLAYSFYHATITKMRWGRPWLNAAFFARIFHDMPEPLELVIASRHGEAIAGAFNVQHGERLFGRYWGCHEEHPLLHFSVCLHHSIDDCISRGLAVFEGGAGGEHKLLRGFDLAPTHGAHWFANPRIDKEIRGFLEHERLVRADELAKWQNRHQRTGSGTGTGHTQGGDG